MNDKPLGDPKYASTKRDGTGQLHDRPGGGQCSYLAEVFCDKCGWVDPERFRVVSHAPPLYLVAFTCLLIGVALGIVLALALVP